MKIVISDFPDTLNRDLQYEVDLLKRAWPEGEVTILPYTEAEELIAELKDADGLLTAFLPVNEELLSQCPKLKCVSVNAIGYDSVDVEAATRRGVAVCAIREYCTEEVADFTVAAMLALAKKLKQHQFYVEQEHTWKYKLVGSVPRLRGKTLAIFGLGRIGQAVAKRAMSFGMEVIAVDPYLPPSVAQELGIKLVDLEHVCKNAHFITNHMRATDENKAMFDADFFNALEKRPYFINAGRATSVEEAALLAALEEHKVSGAALDVLDCMGLNLEQNPLVGRKDVIVTPHAAFYSDESLRALQDISCQNMIHCLSGELDQLDMWVNRVKD